MVHRSGVSSSFQTNHISIVLLVHELLWRQLSQGSEAAERLNTRSCIRSTFTRMPGASRLGYKELIVVQAVGLKDTEVYKSEVRKTEQSEVSSCARQRLPRYQRGHAAAGVSFHVRSSRRTRKALVSWRSRLRISITNRGKSPMGRVVSFHHPSASDRSASERQISTEAHRLALHCVGP